MRRFGVLTGALIALAIAPSAQAAIPSVFTGKTVGGGSIECAPREGVRFCEGSAPGNEPPPPAPDTRVPTFDGVPIDVNVALPPEPASGADGNYPLLMMFHGYGGTKLGFGAMKPFAERGYAVFSMSDRGFGDSCGSAGSRLAQPVACAQGWVKLLDTRFEVRDAQLFAGMLADEGVADPQRIGATGGSYGGGMSMSLAALRDRTMMPDGSLVPWTSPDGKPMRIAAAAPEIPWTDLAYALAPNGGTLDYEAEDNYDGAVGVSKQSYTGLLYAGGQATGYYAPPGADPGADLTTWFARINAGEPYDGDPTAENILTQLKQFHSSYYIDDSVQPAPLLISNGWTDDLFPADEAIRFYNRTLTNYPSAYVSLFFLDYGHARGQGKAPDEAMLAAAKDAFFDHFLKGGGERPEQGVTTLTQTCSEDPETPAPSGGPYSAATWDGISPGEIRFADDSAKTIAPAGGSPQDGQAFDPIAGGGDPCEKTDGSDKPGTATYRLPEASGGGYTLMGSPTVIADISSPSPTSQVAARLLDVRPDGEQTLVARALYRPGVNPVTEGSDRQVFQLHANGWKFEPGHVAKLELLPNDTPYGRASNGQGPVTVENLELRLPTLEASGQGAGGGAGSIQKPAPSIVPDDTRPAPGVVAAGRCETGIEMKGTRRNDRIEGTDGGDALRGKRGKDRIAGRGGDDCINGNKGKDRIRGNGGDDRIRSRDGERDRVSCGKGDDVVTADRKDRVRGCEERKRR